MPDSDLAARWFLGGGVASRPREFQSNLDRLTNLPILPLSKFARSGPIDEFRADGYGRESRVGPW